MKHSAIECRVIASMPRSHRQIVSTIGTFVLQLVRHFVWKLFRVLFNLRLFIRQQLYWQHGFCLHISCPSCVAVYSTYKNSDGLRIVDVCTCYL